MGDQLMGVMWSFRGEPMFTTDSSGDTERYGILLNLAAGFEPADVGGQDWDVPRRSGLVLRPRYAKRRILTAEGAVVGATAADWREYTDDLFAVMDRTLDPGEVAVFPPYLGFSVAQAIQARCVRIVPGPITNRMRHQAWTFELEAVDPPDWEPYAS
jgi:hypothetical protein